MYYRYFTRLLFALLLAMVVAISHGALPSGLSKLGGIAGEIQAMYSGHIRLP